jgi:hypothetical protein
MDKETEHYVDAKVAQAKLQVSEERSKLFVKIIVLLSTIFGIGIPILSKLDIEKRYDKIENDTKLKMAALEEKYNQQPKIETYFNNNRILTGQEIALKCDSTNYIQLGNKGQGRSDFIKIKIYSTDQQYFSYGPMQEYWGNDTKTDDPKYQSMLSKNEQYINPGDTLNIPIQCSCEVGAPKELRTIVKITADKMEKMVFPIKCLEVRKRKENQN